MSHYVSREEGREEGERNGTVWKRTFLELVETLFIIVRRDPPEEVHVLNRVKLRHLLEGGIVWPLARRKGSPH